MEGQAVFIGNVQEHQIDIAEKKWNWREQSKSAKIK